MAFSAPGPCCMQNAPMAVPGGDPRDRVRHVNADAFLPHHDRADVGIGGVFDQVIDRIAAEDFDALALHDFRDRSAELHDGLSPCAGRFGPADLATVGTGFAGSVKPRRRLPAEVLICVCWSGGTAAARWTRAPARERFAAGTARHRRKSTRLAWISPTGRCGNITSPAEVSRSPALVIAAADFCASQDSTHALACIAGQEARMKPVRTFILGSAAGLLAVGGAQAADLPVKAKAIEYVRICSLYGAGFFYIPGTDTCIKLGGYLRADTTFNAAASTASRPGAAISASGTATATISSPARAWRCRSIRAPATEYGVVRTFGQANFQFTNLGSSRNPAILNTSVLNASSGLGCGRQQPAASRYGGRRLCRGRVISSSSSPASRSASPRRPMPSPGRAFRRQHLVEPAGRPEQRRHRCQQHPVHDRSSATACRPRSASTIRRCGIARTSINLVSGLALNATEGGNNVYAGVHAPSRRQHPRRPGLGPVPDFGRRA